MKNMLNFKNFTADELMDILNLALDMKKNPEKYAHALEGKKLYTLFEKTSTRTFLSFTTGITELGGTYYNQLWRACIRDQVCVQECRYHHGPSCQE